MKRRILKHALCMILLSGTLILTRAQEFTPMIFKGYAADSTGTALNGIFDIRLMVIDSKLEDRILWSRIFLNVDIDNGYYDINVAERTDDVRVLFRKGDDLIFRSVILDLGISVQQYMSINFQKIALDENKIFAENYPMEDEAAEIPTLPFMPIKLLCPLENVDVFDESRIELKIINYDIEDAIIRVQFYKGYSDIKTYEFTLESKKVWNEIITDFNSDLIRRKGYIEILSNSDKFIVSGKLISETNDSIVTDKLNWIKIN